MSLTIAHQRRRGMLLLMVMLMLALFMSIGAMLLTIAARARAAARANMSATQQSASNDTVARDALDQSLLAVLRGAISGTNGSVTFTGTTAPILENLLADKYGSPITGTGAITTGTNSPVMTLSLTGPAFSGLPPSRLNGRVLTLNPPAGVGDIASYRILGAETSSGTTTCYVAQMPSAIVRRLPALNTSVPIVVNGREFTPASGTTSPESYDAYDDANFWLAQPVLANGQLSGTYARLSFSGTATTATVDNDNDGILDGVWLPQTLTSGSATPPPYIIPDQPSPLGGTRRFQVSYLILDLDGRINVNAAGMATAQSTYDGTPNTPIGMGYGPADLSAPLLFPASLPNLSGTYSLGNIWSELLLNGTPTTTPAAPTADQRRPPPVIGAIDGRYGSGSTPGIFGDDSDLTQQTTSGTNAILISTIGGTNSLYTLTIGGVNTVADLKAQTRVYMTAPTTGQLTPTLNFYRPTWSGTAGADSVEDPYESRLDVEAPRSGVARRPAVAAGANDDNPFTIAELERVLRPNDPDAAQLPQRLASGLEDLAQRSRMTITTDSWDTPGLTGLAARRIEDYIAALSPALDASAWTAGTSPVSPDIAAGLRFNINRPVLSGTSATAIAQQQEYCKGLYTLAMALGATNSQEAAQWAANVLDFRDADSVLTRFAYDPNPADGWQVTASSPVVYGAERPEIVIVETAAWRDTENNQAQLFVNLHRPATSALLLTATSGSAAAVGTAEISQFALSGTLPLSGWQLRYGANQAVTFANVGASGTTQSQSVFNGTSVISRTTNLSGASLGVPAGLVTTGSGAYLCVLPNSPQNFSAPGLPAFTVDQGGLFQFVPTAATGTVVLERLADPSQPAGPSNPFVAMDSAVLTAIPDVSVASAVLRKNRRTGPQDSLAGSPLAVFWRQSPWQSISNTSLTAYATGTNYTGTTISTGTAPVAWFHWPNRPFISQTELALVPTGNSSTDGVLANYSFPTNSLASSTDQITISSTAVISGSTFVVSSTTSLGSLIVDATYVPSRFAGNAVTITGSSINVVGLDKLQANHFSKWREPGKVNVNTIISGMTVQTGTTASLDDVVWTTLLGNTFTGNPFIPKPAMGPTPTIPARPAVTSPNHPTIPAVPATPANPQGTAAQPASPARSISQVLSLSGTGGPIAIQDFTSGTSFFPRDKNPFFSYAQAIRLANTATIRSQVFAVWITVKITDDSPNAPSPVTKRLFAIIDRSIPVGYSPNQDLNVRDTIRLKRYLD